MPEKATLWEMQKPEGKGQKGRAKPPKATTRPPQGHILGIDSGVQSHPKATPRLHQGSTKATPRPHQGHTEATPKPPPCDPKAIHKPGTCEEKANRLRTGGSGGDPLCFPDGKAMAKRRLRGRAKLAPRGRQDSLLLQLSRRQSRSR